MMAERHTVPAGGAYSRWFVIIVANITAVKLISIPGFVLPAGVIIFPISYIVGDVLTEVYGDQEPPIPPNTEIEVMSR